jgi:3-hydroxybutyryl-CoA dehydrogenase
MGAGIAHALLLAGASVVVIERKEEIAGVRERIARALDSSVERGAFSDAECAKARLSVVEDIGELAESRLVIEAVPEDVDLKVDVFRRVAANVPGETVIASNTSSISLDTLADQTPRPERVLGLHFFNPVPASKLVEVVVTERTAAPVRASAEDWVREMDKTPVTILNSPGFASSRLGVAIGLEAIRMLEEGVATAENIDTAMTLGYGFPMGPLRLTDLVGLDVRLGIARYLEQELGQRFAPPQLLVDMVALGQIGRKSGRGFYEWSEEQ